MESNEMCGQDICKITLYSYQKSNLTACFLQAKESFRNQFSVVKIPKVLGTTWRPFIFISGVIHDAIDSSARSSLSVPFVSVLKIVLHS